MFQKNISLQAADIALSCVSPDDIKSKVEKAHMLMRIMRKILKEVSFSRSNIISITSYVIRFTKKL